MHAAKTPGSIDSARGWVFSISSARAMIPPLVGGLPPTSVSEIVEKVLAIRERNGLRAAVDPELRKDVLNVGRHGLRGYEELLGNAFLVDADRQKPQHLALSFR